MKNLIALLTFLTLLTHTRAQAQSSKKDAAERWRQIQQLTEADIRAGKQLHLAKDYSLEDFIVYYVENGKNRDTKKWGETAIELLYQDSSHTYFVRRTSTGIIDVLKTRSDALNGVNYAELDGDRIRSTFFYSIVPEADRKRVENIPCGSGIESSKYNFKYIAQTGELEVAYRWKINCDLINVINKRYVARYSLATRTFGTPIAIKSAKKSGAKK